MKKELQKYSRGIEFYPLLLDDGGKQVEVDYLFLLKKLDVNEIVRIPAKDYPESATPGEIFVHYNLSIPQDRKGWQIILSRIVKGGFYKSANEEKKPTLSLKDVWRAEVIDFLTVDDYTKLSKDFFTNCIGGAKDVITLKKMLVARYSLSLPLLSENDILECGISVTKLKLIRKVSL